MLTFEGRDSTLYALTGEWHWVGMNNDVRQYIKTCEHCQKCKTRKHIPKPPLRPIIAKEPLERIKIDFTEMDESDPDTGDRYVLTIVDCCTKFLWMRTFPGKHAAPVARALLEIFSSEGYPTIIQFDNGKEFTAAIVKEYIHLISTEVRHSRPKHPQTNGQIERLNGTFKGLLRRMIGNVIGSPWSASAVTAAEKYNSTYHSTIGRTPHEVLRGTRCLRLVANGE